MQRKNWFFSGFLLLGLLLLFSFPTIAFAEDTPVAESVYSGAVAVAQTPTQTVEQQPVESEKPSNDTVEQPTNEVQNPPKTVEQQPVEGEKPSDGTVEQKPAVEVKNPSEAVEQQPSEGEKPSDGTVEQKPAVEVKNPPEAVEQQPSAGEKPSDGTVEQKPVDEAETPIQTVEQQPTESGNVSTGPLDQGSVEEGNQKSNEGTKTDDKPVVKAVTKGISYLVRKGETIWQIGKSLGVDPSNIKATNGITGESVEPGRKLIIPGLDRLAGALSYRIKKGDTFYFIGRALAIDYLKLMTFNNAKDIWIYPDQILKIPGEQDEPLVASASKAKQVTITANDSDLYLLARAIYAEARGESFEGQVAVGAVILNRLGAKGFPKSIRDIIFQTRAFTSVDDGQINYSPDANAIRAAQKALSGSDPSMGALYYWNPITATSKWVWSRPIVKQIGNHVFAL